MIPKHSLASLIAPPRPARAAATPLSQYAGLWKGTFRADDAGTIPFTVRHAGGELGALPVLRFPTRAMGDVALRLVEASATAYVATSEPFDDPVSGAEVTLEIRGARRHNRMDGRWTMRRADGTVAREGAFAAARYAAAAAVNYRW